MNQSLKDKAWKLFEIAFTAALGLYVLATWKSFLGWLGGFVADLIKTLVLLVLIAVVINLVRKVGDSDRE